MSGQIKKAQDKEFISEQKKKSLRKKKKDTHGREGVEHHWLLPEKLQGPCILCLLNFKSKSNITLLRTAFKNQFSIPEMKQMN